MNEAFGKYSENPTNKQLSANENNDSNFSTSKDSEPKPTTTIEDSMQKSKAYAVLNTLDSQGESISKEDEKIYISILEKKDLKFLNDLTSKPKKEILKFLIESQINTLKTKGFAKLSKEERVKFGQLSKQLIIAKDSTIAIEKDETADNDKLIASKDADLEEENQKQISENNKQKAYSEVNANLSSIKGSLGNFKGESKGVNKIFALLNSAEKYKVGPNSSDEEVKKGADEMNKAFKKIMKILHNPIALHLISKDLKEYDKDNGTTTYENFKSAVLEIDPSINFETADMVPSLAMARLGTTNLSGVDLDSGVLSQTEDGVNTSYSKDSGRILSTTGEGNTYKVSSEVNPKYSQEILDVNVGVKEELKPLNESLNIVSRILQYLKNSQKNGEDFTEVKELIKIQNPDFYSNEGLDNITSFDEMILVLNARKTELEDEKEEVIIIARERVNKLLEENQKEITEKEKHKKEMLKFFHSIGFDRLSQTESDKVIDLVNINPGNYGLDSIIDLENGNLGFNKDHGDKTININEKIAFVEFFNKMLGEDVIRVNERLQTIIPLDSNDENKLQKLLNKKAGFFMGNLEKIDSQ